MKVVKGPAGSQESVGHCGHFCKRWLPVVMGGGTVVGGTLPFLVARESLLLGLAM